MAALLAEPDALAASLPDVEEETARAALRRASGAVRSYCGWNLAREAVTDYVGLAERGVTLYLPTLYLVSVESLNVYGWGVLDPAVFAFARDGRIMLPTAYRTWGNLVVSYTHGYDSGSPEMDHIRGVVLGAAIRLVDNPTGRRHQQIGGESWTLATGPMEDPNSTLSSGEKAELDRYALPRL